MAVWDNRVTETEISNGMASPSDSAERKRVLKRQALIWWALIMLPLMLPSVFLSYTSDLREVLKTKRFNELRVIEGEYYIFSFIKHKSRVFRSALRISTTGKRTFSGDDALCNIAQYRKNFIGRPAKMWYALSEHGSAWIYQLEVDGRIVCSLDEVNASIPAFNSERKSARLWTGLICFIISSGVAIAASYSIYRVRLKKVPLQQEQAGPIFPS